jgi:23S rRNA (cytidine2498-2'-O)-methyltransferase
MATDVTAASCYVQAMIAPAPLRLLCHPGFEASLIQELRRVAGVPFATRLADGVVEASTEAMEALAGRPLAFACQALPAAMAHEAESVTAWCETVFESLEQRLADHDGPWRLHLLGASTAWTGRVPRRLTLIEAGLRRALKRRRRARLRALRDDAGAAFSEDEALVQIMLDEPARGVVSVTLPDERAQRPRILSPLPAGWVDVARDLRPPSRAYRKLLEVQRRMGRQVEGAEACVDLGASPGGWTFVALDQGARVTAVDRVPLRDDLMAHPRLRFVRGDAFRFQPEATADWLLSDLIVAPERLVALSRRWLAAGWCRGLIVTLKFKGAVAFDVIDDMAALLDTHFERWDLRHLLENKHEVTAWGFGVREEARGAPRR